MKKTDKHIIWTSDIKVDDWSEAYEEFCEINDIPYEDDEDKIYEFAIEANNEYIDDERLNLNIDLPEDILIIADLGLWNGLWNGRRSGYKEIHKNNIADCLYSEADDNTWYVDSLGDLCCTASHHDGTNYYTYRMWKQDVTESQRDNLLNKIYNGSVTRKDITRYTERLGDYIANVYGWKIPRLKTIINK